MGGCGLLHRRSGLFALWARVILGRNWSGVVTLKEGHELVERGPYRFVRHPIYTGMVAMFFATALVQRHLAGFVGALLMFVSFWIKLRTEENLMLQQFPERYADYGKEPNESFLLSSDWAARVV